MAKIKLSPALLLTTTNKKQEKISIKIRLPIGKVRRTVTMYYGESALKAYGIKFDKKGRVK